MHLLLVGISHAVAEVEVREKAALGPGAVAPALRGLRQRPEVAGAFVLSTCGRTEVYVTGPHLAPLALAVRSSLQEWHSDRYRQYAEHLYRRADRSAAQHLFRVATGLDSLLIGESEILGQVRAAIKVARAAGALDGLLGGTTDRAVAAARRARTESGLGRSAGGIAQAAAAKLNAAGLRIEDARILIVGAGEVAAAVAAELKGSADSLTIASRTPARAERLARNVDAAATGLDDLAALVATADLAVFAAASPKPLLRPADLALRTQPLVILDLGVPRNVDPAVALVPVVTLLGLDELSRASAGLEAGRAATAEQTLREEIAGWTEWFRLEGVIPTLAALNEYADGIRRAELARAARGLNLDATTGQRLEALSRSLVAKLLIHPIGYLRDHPDDLAAAQLIEKIFTRPPRGKWN